MVKWYSGTGEHSYANVTVRMAETKSEEPLVTIPLAEKSPFRVRYGPQGMMVYGIGEQYGTYISYASMARYAQLSGCRNYHAKLVACVQDVYGKPCGHPPQDHDDDGCNHVVDYDYEFGQIRCLCEGYVKPAPLVVQEAA